ncbi:MAG: hypothetical protein VB128_01690 [Sedimentibacter saalensis]|uniref:hypothetical protein n=1 Tax=Sedimentibacter saalensis TaxID=130788 RepID=UPI002B20EA4B|nr:hypothetical protein [Sedimentibacter saalensis]MEA5093644.1 hypothetical protein [Sedimentibacter saalensis]
MKFDRKLFNWSVWIILVLTYIVPYQIDGLAIKCGFPIRFWRIYISTTPNSSLLNSSSLNLLELAINILIAYLIISFVYKLYINQRTKKTKNR